LNPKISIAIDLTSDEKTVHSSAVVLTKFFKQYQSKITQAFYMITRGFISQEDSHSPLSDFKFQPLEREKSAREA
jgi:primosomal replication protein N